MPEKAQESQGYFEYFPGMFSRKNRQKAGEDGMHSFSEVP